MRADRGLAPWLLRVWELLGPRLPRPAWRLVFRILLRLPRGSRVRRWLVLQFAAIGWNVTARGRHDLVLPMWDLACEWHWDTSLRALGFDEVYRGHDGVKRSLARWNENWTEVSFTVREVLVGGDTFVVRSTGFGRGVGSGVPVHMHFSSVARLNPLLVDWRNFIDDSEELREAGFGAVAEQRTSNG
jgi:hypothetical protein